MSKNLLSRAIPGVILAATVGVMPAAFASESYPQRPVTIVVPFGSGGSADVYARYLGEALRKSLGQSFIVENKPGAGAVIGTAQVARAAPDGYTLLLMSNTHTVNETIIKDKPYDLLRDFDVVAPINEASLVLVAPPRLQANTVEELIALAKTKPGAINYASSGVGTPYHIAGELLKTLGGINTQHVPYKSSGQARIGVVGGEVDYMFDATATMQSFVQDGRVKALATTGTQRSPVFPDLPTMQEAGVKGYDANIWLGVLAPKGTPEAVTEKLNKAISDIASSPEVKAAWAKDGAVPMVMSRAEFAEYLKADIERLRKIALDANLVEP